MEQKIAAYICTGCGIGEALDIEQLSQVATSECGAAICKTHANLCSQEGAGLIKSDIEKEGVLSIIGPNGAGKTTFFNLLTGFYQPTSGKVTFKGKDVHIIMIHKTEDISVVKLVED